MASEQDKTCKTTDADKAQNKDNDEKDKLFTQLFLVSLWQHCINWDEIANIDVNLRVLTSKQAKNWFIDDIIPPTEIISVGDPDTGKIQPLKRAFNVFDTFTVFCTALGTFLKEKKAILFSMPIKMQDPDVKLYYQACLLFVKKCIAAGLNFKEQDQDPIHDSMPTIKAIANKFPLMAVAIHAACS
jgi:hypothetical protein